MSKAKIALYLRVADEIKDSLKIAAIKEGQTTQEEMAEKILRKWLVDHGYLQD